MGGAVSKWITDNCIGKRSIAARRVNIFWLAVRISIASRMLKATVSHHQKLVVE
jgi:hypothetical protein